MKIRFAALLLAISLVCGSAMAAPRALPAETSSQSVGDDGIDYGWGWIFDLIKKLVEQAANR